MRTVEVTDAEQLRRGVNGFVSVRYKLTLLTAAWSLAFACCVIPGAVSALTLQPPQSLASVLGQIRWNTEVNGTLLVVSPEKTVNQDNIPRGDGSFKLHENRTFPEADANGVYQMTGIEDYFDRRLVHLHSITVLAPTEMTVLNTTRLPRADTYSGVNEGAKARLLFSSFSPDQWRALASPEGIGIADMNARQRELFLSILPEPFQLHSVSRVVTEGRRIHFTESDPQTLTPNQREAIRLSMYKQFDWAYQNQAGNYMGIQATSLTAEPTLELVSPQYEFAARSDAFGVALRAEIPNRSKPSQLPYDWSGYDVDIPLDGVKTVGGLVRLIAERTRSELYCDPRYAHLSVWIRGASGKGGDLLHALAWAVTGTWRRLGNAFVLTDDLTGLGVRHAIIGDWIQENLALAKVRDIKIDNLLTDAHAAAWIGWHTADPTSPSDELSRKIDDFENSRDPNVGTLPLLVRTSDLSPETQKLIRQRADAYLAEQPVFPGVAPQAIRTNAVYVTPNLKATYIIPGIGTVEAPNLAVRLGRSPFYDSGRRGKNVSGDLGKESIPRGSSLVIPPGLATRALLVTPLTPADVDLAAREARRRGFTDLWVQVPKGDSSLISHAVAAGKANGLAVRAVLRLLRAGSPAKPDQLDRNILGQTVSERARAWTERLGSIQASDFAEPNAPPRPESLFRIFAADWSKADEVRNLIQDGDYFRCDDESVAMAIAADIKRAASIKGIAGIVLRDTSAPGYAPGVYAPAILRSYGSSFCNDPVMPLGYTEANRLGFLRKHGLDPIDLSPLEQGDFVHIGPTAGGTGYCTLQLPFFHDSGTDAAIDIHNSLHQATADAGDSISDWYAFRKSVNTALIQRVLQTVRAEPGAVPVILRHEADRLGEAGTFFGSAEPPDAAPPREKQPKGAAKSAARPILPAGHAMDLGFDRLTPERARQESKTIYYAVTLPHDALNSPAATALFLASLAASLEKAKAWDGVVVDLSAAPIKDALDILAGMADTVTRREGR